MHESSHGKDYLARSRIDEIQLLVADIYSSEVVTVVDIVEEVSPHGLRVWQG
jgi:hypothetical protein